MNITELKNKVDNIVDGITARYYRLTQPQFESVVVLYVVVFGFLGTILVVYDYKADIAKAAVELEKIQLQRNKQTGLNLIELERLKIAGNVAVLEQQVKIAEIRAATNPYIIESNHILSPINLFVDVSNYKHEIETLDGASKIAIGMITINDTKYTPEQRKLMTMAFHIGRDIGYPETIQSLLLQETLAGAFGDRIGDTNLPMGRRSYGVMQMKVATARKVLKKHTLMVAKYFPKREKLKKVRDEELIIRLIQDDEFNIRLATLNFNIHRKSSKSWAQAVVAYNTGQGAANGIKHPKKHVYYNHILKRMISQVRPFNRETKLTL